MKNLFIRMQLWYVRVMRAGLNFFLAVLERTFFRNVQDPKNIVIYKVGNIGDIVCAIPAFIAIRRTYPGARVTLLTSPGRKGAPGAVDFLTGVSYLDDFYVYYVEDLSSRTDKKKFIRDLRGRAYDLFIQIPDDWADFRTILRNLFFAKLIGARGAFGFRVRTLLNVFWNAQVDYSWNAHESMALLNIVKNGGVRAEKIEFEFPSQEKYASEIQQLFVATWPEYENKLIVGIAPGGKGEEKRWSPERFSDIAEYLVRQYGAKVIIFGAGREDEHAAEIIQRNLDSKSFLNVVSRDPLNRRPFMLQQCDFLLTNDSGNMHIAAAIGVPTVALFSVRNILGGWFPYGDGHEVLYHRFLDCDYRDARCVRRSMEAITVDEVKAACDRIIARIKKQQ